MNLELRSLVKRGDLANERLTLRAKQNLDLGDYLVAQSGFIDDSPTTTFFHTLWFPFKSIQKGDLVVVYTKNGTNKERVLDRGNKAHFFYFDLDTAIWDEPHTGAIVLFAPTWQAQASDDLRGP